MENKTIFDFSKLENISKAITWLERAVVNHPEDEECFANLTYLKKYYSYVKAGKAASEKRIQEYLDTPLMKEYCTPERLNKVKEEIDEEREECNEAYKEAIEALRSEDYCEVLDYIDSNGPVRLTTETPYPKQFELLFLLLHLATANLDPNDPRILRMDEVEAYDYAMKCFENGLTDEPNFEDFVDLDETRLPNEYCFELSYGDKVYYILYQYTYEAGLPNPTLKSIHTANPQGSKVELDAPFTTFSELRGKYSTELNAASLVIKLW